MKVSNLFLAGALILGGAIADAADCRIIIPSRLGNIRNAQGVKMVDVMTAAASSLNYRTEMLYGLSTANGGFLELNLPQGREGEKQASAVVERIGKINVAAENGLVFLLSVEEQESDNGTVAGLLSVAHVESLAAEGKDFLDGEILVLGEITTKTDVETDIVLFQGSADRKKLHFPSVNLMRAALARVLPFCK